MFLPTLSNLALWLRQHNCEIGSELITLFYFYLFVLLYACFRFIPFALRLQLHTEDFLYVSWWATRLHFTAESRDSLTTLCEIGAVSGMLSAPKHRIKWDTVTPNADTVALPHLATTHKRCSPTVCWGYGMKVMYKMPYICLLRWHCVWIQLTLSSKTEECEIQKH